MKGRIDALHAADPEDTGPVPVDLVTSSGSGLDPEISPAAAEYQVQRVATRAAWTERGAVAGRGAHRGPQLGILGEPRVNVLELNLALDAPLTLSCGGRSWRDEPREAVRRRSSTSSSPPWPGSVLTVLATLAMCTWGTSGTSSSRTARPRLLVTEPGVGYRMKAD